MIFVEFVSKNHPTKGSKHYFAGESLKAVLDDTKDGTEFGFAKFSSHKEITEAEIRTLNVPFLNQGIEKFKDSVLKSVHIGYQRR